MTPGGVGKSALVEWVTYEFYRSRKFEAILNLSAKETALTNSGIRPCRRSLYSLDNLLDHIIACFGENIPNDFDEKKRLATDILSLGPMLLVLDNMETVTDGRIISFLQQLPQETMAKILMTSRHKTGGWEYAIPVNELGFEEAKVFLSIKSMEMDVDFPNDDTTCRKVLEISGGLPLAMQWIIGRYKLERNITSVINDMQSKDSPVLEFTFRNIWNKLSSDAKAILAVITIFEEPPTIQQIAIATEWSLERIEKGLAELGDVTLLTHLTQQSDGKVVYTALPITLNFARYQFANMGDFEVLCRQRFQKYIEQMNLQEFEVRRFKNIFERYDLISDNEKKAAILCNRGQSEMFSGNTENADALFRQAREFAPLCSYVGAMSASYELARNRVGIALEYAKSACGIANKKTGALTYTILARVLDVQRDRLGRLDALQKALQYEPDDVFIRHQYGVALSRVCREKDAVQVFTEIIEEEKKKSPLRETLLLALKTRVINLRRLGRMKEAEIDIVYANKVLEENPHLQHQARHIAELEENIDDDGTTVSGLET